MHAFDTFSQADCVSGRIFGKLMGSHEQWLGTVFLLLAARTCTHTEPPNVPGEETVCGPTGDSNRGPLANQIDTFYNIHNCFNTYRNDPKFSDTKNICCNHSKV